MGCGFSFLKSAKDGAIVVELGTTLSYKSAEFETLKDICPTNAFELDASVNKKELIDSLVNQLTNYQGISKPTAENLRFKSKEFSIPIPYASGEYRYEYSSDRAANSAARRAFESAMYSQIDALILKVITEYRVKYIKPYYAENSEGSIYVESNRKVSELLEGIRKLAENNLPENFSLIDVHPYQEPYVRDACKMLRKGEIIGSSLVSSVRNQFTYSVSDYECYWDTDDREEFNGTDWRGNYKTKDVYCYKNLNDAFKELSKDLLNACDWASDNIEYQATMWTESLVNSYNELLKKTISEKLAMIK